LAVLQEREAIKSVSSLFFGVDICNISFSGYAKTSLTDNVDCPRFLYVLFCGFYLLTFKI